MKRIAVLGSTGSIGTQTLEVAEAHPDLVRVVALGAYSNHELLSRQIDRFNVTRAGLVQSEAARALQARLDDRHSRGETTGFPADVSIVAGTQGLCELASLHEVDIVVNAITGFAGLAVSVAALKAGKTLALANKESLVAGGELVMSLAAPDKLLPVDSEHSAIFQCLLGEKRASLSRIWLTASGGPFRNMTAAELEHVTVEDALAHPTWSMGQKISIDSATLMNKGLEVIEAKHLFNVSFDQIEVIIHPESCIHSMVEFCDGSVKAHLGATTMKVPIQFALSYPDRWSAPVPPVDFATLASLTFERPDTATFGCLELAIAAGREGGTCPAVLNAANEVAVAAFLQRRCSFVQIEEIIARTLDTHEAAPLESIEQIEGVDAEARKQATLVVNAL